MLDIHMLYRITRALAVTVGKYDLRRVSKILSLFGLYLQIRFKMAA